MTGLTRLHRLLGLVEFSASKDLLRKPRAVIDCIMCAANPAGKSCENVLSYCEATLLKLFHFDILSWTIEGMIRLRVRMTIIDF